MIDQILSFLNDNFSEISLGANVFIMVLIVIGVLNRRNAKRHMKIMLTCFVVDMINLVAIEVRNAAINKSYEAFLSLENIVLIIHILVSTIMVVCYVIAIYTGRRLYKRGIGRKGHKRNAVVFLASRLANCITAFMV